MRSCRPCAESRVEVQAEARIEFEAIALHLQHVDLVVAVEVDLPEVVLVQEVIGDDEALVVVGLVDYMGAVARTQGDDAERLG